MISPAPGRAEDARQTGARTSVVLADDHAVIREALRRMLDAEPDLDVVGEAADAPEALRRCEELRPDVLVLDLRMPGGPGLGAISELRARSPETSVVVLTVEGGPNAARAAIAAGALGYVPKEAATRELLGAIRAAARGHPYLDPVTGALVAAAPQPEAPELSERELEILTLLALGYSNPEAAERLGLSVRTIESHRARIQKQLGIKRRSELVRYALEHGVLREPLSSLSAFPGGSGSATHRQGRSR